MTLQNSNKIITEISILPHINTQDNNSILEKVSYINKLISSHENNFMDELNRYRKITTEQTLEQESRNEQSRNALKMMHNFNEQDRLKFLGILYAVRNAVHTDDVLGVLEEKYSELCKQAKSTVIVANTSSSVSNIIHPEAVTKLRKNKYGLEMTVLEQELDDIKLGLNDKDIERYQGARYEHPKYGKEDAVEFFNRVYGKYKEASCIFQDDLLAIDQKLHKALENLLGKKENKYDMSFSAFLPTSSKRVELIGKKASEYDKTLSYFGTKIRSKAI